MESFQNSLRVTARAGPMVYGYSKTLKEEQREELFESLKVNNSIGWEVDVICPKDLSAKMLKKKSKVNLNEISHNSAMSLVRKVLDMGVLLAEVTRDRALRNWVFDETALSLHMKTGSGYPGDPDTKQWLEDHKHPVFGFPTLVRFSWETCKPFFKDAVEVTWESDEVDEDGTDNGSTKRQVKLD
ncbi:unnamed protein product [Miscanthus lutarioriparius]|uniref:Ribonuclease n=1 Tax=Miscanthus lutarioriparius TaxID=422564 RepID=A0A811REW6_9POAL|nr:unnamed protein product [Miscanthus lutarioriparius]